jgi:hypothetical protein
MGYNGIRFPDEDTSYSTTFSSSGCAHHWKLGEGSGNLVDEIDTNLPLDVNYSTITQGASGIGGRNCLNASGGEKSTGAYTTAEKASDPFHGALITSMTIEGFVNLTGTYESAAQGGKNYTSVLTRRQNGNSTILIDLWWNGSSPDSAGPGFQIYIPRNPGSALQGPYNTTNYDLISLNTWAHFAVVYDVASTGTELQLYIDNVQIQTWSPAYTPGTSSSGFVYCGVPGYGSGIRNTSGLFQDFAWWYNQAITDFSDGGGGGSIAPYTHHHINSNCQKDDKCGLIQRPTLKETIEINRR